MLCVNASARSKLNPPLPSGYYGITFVFPTAITKVKNLRQNSFGYAVELIKKAKAIVTEEYVKSIAALMVLRGKRLSFPNVIGSFILSDVTKIRFEDVDLGWGKAVFGGPAKGIGVMSFFTTTKNKKGEVGSSVAIRLPSQAMERFLKELDNIILLSSAL